MDSISEKPKFGIIFSTYACAPYVHLFLESAKRNFPCIPIVIVDDGSQDFHYISNIIRNYDNVDFIWSPRRLGHAWGDINALMQAIICGRNKKWDLAIKFSRRFIPYYDWTEKFRKLAYETQSATYSNICQNQHLSFRTECIAFHVNTWFETGAVFQLLHYNSNLVETHVYEIAKKINPNYAKWELLGENRKVKKEGVLWHHNSIVQDYLSLSETYGLHYKINDFTNIVF